MSRSKSDPWNWSPQRTLAAELGLPSLKNFWPFWEGSGNRVAELVSGANGVLISAPPWRGSGAGRGVTLDGSTNHYVSVANHPTLTPPGAFTAWVYVCRNSVAVRYAPMAKSNGSTAIGSAWEFIVANSGDGAGQGLLRWVINVGSTNYFAEETSISTGDTKPHVIVGTYNGVDTISLYVDGRLRASAAASGAVNSVAQALRFGQQGDGDRKLAGTVLGAGMEHRCWTAAQVALLSAVPYAYHCRANEPWFAFPTSQIGRSAVYYRVLQQHLGLGY